jgi:hypothetical protein
MRTTSVLRALATLAAPLTVASLVLVIAAGATAGADVESSPLAVVSSALLLVAGSAIGSVAVACVGRGRSVAGPVVAVVGSVLVVGGQWAALFVLPALSSTAPHLLSSGALHSVTVGYVASYAVFALGWVLTGVALLRSRAVPTWLGVLLIVGAVAALVPAPEAVRLLIISIAATLTGRRITEPSRAIERVAQPA